MAIDLFPKSSVTPVVYNTKNPDSSFWISSFIQLDAGNFSAGALLETIPDRHLNRGLRQDGAP